MKKVLLMLLSVVLCLSMLTGCFTTTEEILDDVDDAVANENPNENANPNEAPSNTANANMQVAIDSFNKLDLSALAGTSLDYMSIINELALSAGFEMSGTVNGSESNMSLEAAIKNGVVYLKSEMSGEGEDEVFVKFNDETFDMYYRGATASDDEMSEWEKTTSSIADMMDTDPEMVTDIISKITIPKLEDKYLTEKNGMLLVSNDYVVELVMANSELIGEITGQEITDDQIAEARESMTKTLQELEFELFIGTNSETINKVAVSLNAESNKIYGELALTADAKALDYVTVKITHDFSAGEFVYTPESVITFKTILGEDNALVGCKLDFNIVSEGKIVMSKVDGSNTTKQNITYTNIAISAEINLANIGKANANIATMSIKNTDTKRAEVVCEIDQTTGERTVISGKETEITYTGDDVELTATLKSVNDKKITLDAAFKSENTTVTVTGELNYTVSDDKLDFDGTLKTQGTDLEFSGFINAGDFTMPALPNVQ